MPARRPASRRPADSGTPPRAWIGIDLYAPCIVTAAEIDEAAGRARTAILKRVPAVAPGVAPHLLITIGAAGAGKSTVAAVIAAARSRAKYVVLDYDLAVKFHPRFRDVWNIPDLVTGKPSEVGLALGYINCNIALEDILLRLCNSILSEGPRYNMIVQSHRQMDLIDAKLAGYRTTLLYVGVPLAVAQRRSRARAIETGKFLAPTLHAQDELVERMWQEYGRSAPWFGLWADEFLVADNRRDDGGASATKTVRAIPLHGEGPDWYGRLEMARKAIQKTHDP